MENENISTAYHESARVVFAYLNGFACDSIELRGKGSDTNSKLNAGTDMTFVKGVLSANPLSLSPENLKHGIEVAKKLMSIYCAGTCAEIFFQNNLKIPGELELDISGQDLTMIEKIQTFLKKAVIDHPDDFPSQAIVSVFKQLKDDETWKAVELLASNLLQQESKSLKRFYIEDALMQAGIGIQKATTRSGFSLGVHEDDTEKPAEQETKAGVFEVKNLRPLDILVRDFLKKIKNNWQEEELTAATGYLHDIYKKYGQ